MTPSSFVSMFLAFADKLKFGNLFIIVVSLFALDLVVPDFIPLIDEIILGLLAILLANWKKERLEEIEKEIIEGEIIDAEKDEEK
jgi:hypothetical protein